MLVNGIVKALLFWKPANCFLVKRVIYYAFIQCYLMYCLVVWGNASQYLLHYLLVLQKKAICLVYNSHYVAHCSPLTHNLKVLFVQDLYRVRCLSRLFKIVNRLSTLQLSCHITTVGNAVCYNLRHPARLSVLGSRLSLRKSSFLHSSINIWNSSPDNIVQITIVTKVQGC